MRLRLTLAVLLAAVSQAQAAQPILRHSAQRTPVRLRRTGLRIPAKYRVYQPRSAPLRPPLPVPSSLRAPLPVPGIGSLGPSELGSVGPGPLGRGLLGPAGLSQGLGQDAEVERLSRRFLAHCLGQCSSQIACTTRCFQRLHASFNREYQLAQLRAYKTRLEREQARIQQLLHAPTPGPKRRPFRPPRETSRLIVAPAQIDPLVLAPKLLRSLDATPKPLELPALEERPRRRFPPYQLEIPLQYRSENTGERSQNLRLRGTTQSRRRLQTPALKRRDSHRAQQGRRHRLRRLFRGPRLQLRPRSASRSRSRSGETTSATAFRYDLNKQLEGLWIPKT